MRKIVLYIAASLDGYIARPDGNIDWLHDEAYTIPGEDFGYSSFLQTVDTTLMGHTTYQTVLGLDMPFPYPDKKNYVFSRNKSHQDTEFAAYVKEDAVEFLRKLKEGPGQDIWLIGGGQLNTLVLNTGLLDEIILTYIPVLLGKGIPLFAHGVQEAKMNRTTTKAFDNGFTQLTFAT
ncbi:dihydrofolate reductase family protein [Botryobacter ruber]|uniref:dihydrofolate reductase family protein n=1 Tax=Botryobacter ruber TaxID=2171629 RepID=UPI000E0C10F9|nr:dihydrofolate reductase family protein [Botryobacter ruber]